MAWRIAPFCAFVQTFRILSMEVIWSAQPDSPSSKCSDTAILQIGADHGQ